MTTRRNLLGTACTLATTWAVFGRGPAWADAGGELSEAEWRKRLTPAQYAVLRRDGTERAFSSPLLQEHRHGTFACAGCSQALFSSETKFDSGTGWPSFYASLPGAVAEVRDSSFGMERTAVRCSRCEGHLGHVFNDGPKPTGLRYCMNGVAMRFAPAAV